MLPFQILFFYVMAQLIGGMALFCLAKLFSERYAAFWAIPNRPRMNTRVLRWAFRTIGILLVLSAFSEVLPIIVRFSN
jgi:hypothetical protein